ncbi:hypothetical protein DYU05_17305 [Mucilaginibacter terrenus]|uniref:Uncharacterized protein n=1 Tax=Mucilaginibacter terrenus TaxID=2482727 RepID=A0A3E2NMY6_9SPHI|nr:NB-ARC domain-containing protein [Mucilaginibacter terrenus]RFZ82364.1 hypothetical protein DYU05_17305 [Mucilaginibacter terrenus]
MNLIQRNFKIAVKDDLNALNGTEFEMVCRTILELILNEPITLEGQNLYAKPVKSTADMGSTFYDTVGQCGTDVDYYEKFEKPIKDTEGAIGNHPKSKVIYLFSNRFATTSKISDLNDLIKSKQYNQTVFIYDSDKIGDVLLDNISSAKLESIWMYLSRSYELFKIFPDTNKLPNFKSKYYSRPEESAIIDLLNNRDHLQVYGLSGIGKTELTISVAHTLKDQFDTVIFIEGDYEQNLHFNINGVRLSKFDQLINLSNILEKYRILLILDNFNDNVNRIIADFLKANSKKSKCIITSLQSQISADNTYNLLYLSDGTATAILEDSLNPPDESQLDFLIKEIKGYPLILNILKANVENGSFSWDEIIKEIGSVIQLNDPESKDLNIAKRVVGFVKDKYDKAFAFLKYVNPHNRKINRYFIKSILGTLVLSNFQKSSFINIQDAIYYDVHKIVLDAIISYVNEIKYEDEFDDNLLKFLSEQNQKKGSDFYSMVFNHREFLNQKLTHTNDLLKKTVLYAIIQATDIRVNPASIIEKLEQLKLNDVEYIDVLLLIEMFEIVLFQIKSDTDRVQIAEKQISKLADILQKTIDSEIKINLLHHIGKIYAKVNNPKMALQYFDQVIAINPKADYCILQITRIYDQKRDYDASKNNLKLIFEDEEILKNISVSLLLSFYDILSVSKYEHLRKQYIDTNINNFVIKLVQSLDAKFDQPYQTINKYSDILSYSFPEEFEFIMESLPEPSNIDANNELKYNYANTLSVYYKHLKDRYSKADKEEKMNSIKKSLLEYFEFIETISLNDFQKRNVGKFWLNMEDYLKALNVVKDLDYSDGEFNNQTLCKIYKGLKDYDKANIAIDTAIALGIKKRTASKFMAAFYHDKSEVEYYQNSVDCLRTLETAIDTSIDNHLKEQWRLKLDLWAAKFNN